MISPFLASTIGPVVIAHRGASGYLPEHTLESKVMAHTMGAHFLEQDVVLSKDDVPVVLHDIMLDPVTDVAVRFSERHREDGHFYALDFTLEELKCLRVVERFDPQTGRAVYPDRFPKDSGTFRIPTLEEELQLIRGLNKSTGREVGIYPEIKHPAWHCQQGHDISAIVLPILRRYGYATKADPCWVQCFEWEEVKRLRRELQWDGRLLQLYGGWFGEDGTDYLRLRTPDGLAEVAAVADGIGPAISAIISGSVAESRVISDLVKDAHGCNLAVHPYTARRDELPKSVRGFEDLLIALFDEAGVDGVFSDFPDVVIRWFASRTSIG